MILLEHEYHEETNFTIFCVYWRASRYEISDIEKALNPTIVRVDVNRMIDYNRFAAGRWRGCDLIDIHFNCLMFSCFRRRDAAPQECFAKDGGLGNHFLLTDSPECQ